MRNRKTWLWILCAALVVCIAVVCIILFTGKESAEKRQSQITTDAEASQDKQDANRQSGANGQQNGGNSGGEGDSSSVGQTDDGDTDIDYPYVDIPAEPDGDTPVEQASGDTPVIDSPGGDISGGNSSGDIVLPMVP